VEISNRSITLLLFVTVSLVAGALALTFFKNQSGSVTGGEARAMDFHLKPEVVRTGGIKSPGSARAHTTEGTSPHAVAVDVKDGPLVVEIERVGAYDAARLVCDMFMSERPFERNKVVFPTIPFGECSIRLVGTEVAYAPVYPGDALRCDGVDGQTQCTGGVAARQAATVTVRSALPGALEVDGDPYGPLPLENLRIKVGERQLAVRLDDGRILRWKLVIKPEEQIDVYFPSPDDPGAVTGA
jgi:hypothetical protein